MADVSYDTGVYRKQGSDELVVATSGFITVESGGQIDVESGGKIDLESGGYIAAASGGYISLASGSYISVASGAQVRTPVAAATTATPNHGAFTLAAKAAKIVAPVAGCRAIFVVSSTTGGDSTLIPTTVGVNLDYTGNRKATFSAKDQVLVLEGISATQWAVTGNVGTVTLGAT